MAINAPCSCPPQSTKACVCVTPEIPCRTPLTPLRTISESPQSSLWHFSRATYSLCPGMQTSPATQLSKMHTDDGPEAIMKTAEKSSSKSKQKQRKMPYVSSPWGFCWQLPALMSRGFLGVEPPLSTEGADPQAAARFLCAQHPTSFLYTPH